MNIAHIRALNRQAGQFKVVGGKKSKRVAALGKFCESPCQGQTIVGAGTPANFIRKHQAVGCGVVENVGGFRHLDHEGRAPAGQIVGSADAGEYAVNGSKGCMRRRYSCPRKPANISMPFGAYR